jgi:hypothetical protein
VNSIQIWENRAIKIKAALALERRTGAFGKKGELFSGRAPPQRA